MQYVKLYRFLILENFINLRKLVGINFNKLICWVSAQFQTQGLVSLYIIENKEINIHSPYAAH